MCTSASVILFFSPNDVIGSIYVVAVEFRMWACNIVDHEIPSCVLCDYGFYIWYSNDPLWNIMSYSRNHFSS